MAVTGDATTNEVTTVVSGVVPSIENNDPIGNLMNSQRVNQQQIFPSAVTNKFLNPVQQFPNITSVGTSVSLNDVKQVTVRLSDGLGLNPPASSAIAFRFQGSTGATLMVTLCTTIVIDGEFYPFGADIFLANWDITRIKSASFFDQKPDRSFTNPLCSIDQDCEWLIINAFDSGADHTIDIYYYWRGIINQGGSASTPG